MVPLEAFITYSSSTCNSNFIGYNFLYSHSHCKSYSTDHVAIGHLIREIRCSQTHIPGFSHEELDSIVTPRAHARSGVKQSVLSVGRGGGGGGGGVKVSKSHDRRAHFTPSLVKECDFSDQQRSDLAQ